MVTFHFENPHKLIKKLMILISFPRNCQNNQNSLVKMIMNIILITLLLSSILTQSVFASEKTKLRTKVQTEATKDQHAQWSYLGVENPNHWGMLSEEYKTCESGNRQSPIDITMTHHGDHHQKLEFHYQTSQLHEMNNGHTIQVSHVSNCRVDLNDHNYKLRQFHFHSPSEHHIEGNAFPMEMHLVHQDETGHVLVIAVMMEADATQPVLTKLWRWLPDQIAKEVTVPLQLSLIDLLPTNTHHYTYSGSLTTPPCTEGVQWIVLKEPMHITQQDVDQFVHIIGHNACPIQPIRKRHIDED